MVMMSSYEMQHLTWKKSSRSGTGPDSNCVEVAYNVDMVLLRDSKQASATSHHVLSVDHDAWTTVIAALADRQTN